MNTALSTLSDGDLLTEVKARAACERDATARLVACLSELDARRLYLGEGCSSLFTYCTQVLRLSEDAAYTRIEAARAARRFPAILDLLGDGSVTLTAVRLLSPHLTPENHREVLASARHRGKREVEHIVASLRPLPPVPSVVRKLPAARTAQPQVPIAGPTAIQLVPEQVACPRPPTPAVVRPLAPERYKLQITMSREAHDHLRRAQELLRHSVPNGDPARIVERALALLVAELSKTKAAMVARPRSTAAHAGSHTRHVPAAVKREVWQRDGGQCAFAGTTGRCTERGFLEYHHVVPYAEGGPTTATNLQLRCRAHNAYEGVQHFGAMWADAACPATSRAGAPRRRSSTGT